MAADDDTTTAPAPATASPDLLAQLGPLLKQLMPQPVQQDTTPVSRSWTSLLGQALAGGAPVAGMSDADKETAGSRALMNFGTSLMAASRYQPGQTIFSNLASGLQGAQQGEIGAEEMAMAKLGAQQEYAQQQAQNKLEAIKTALPFLRMQQGAGMPNLLAGGGGGPPAPNVAQGGSIATVARDTSMTAGQQGNNSGNLMVDNTLPPGAVGRIPVSGGRFVAAFPDVPTGIAAQADNLSGYASRGINTVQDALVRWTGQDLKNIPAGYVSSVAKALGVNPTDPIDLSNPKVQRAFLLAQQPNESGKSWLQPSDVDKGIALAVARRGVPGAPPVVGAPPGSPPASTASTTPPGPVVHTSPTLRGPGSPVPPTPQPSIQGVPDTGGAQVAGPGALPGKVAPPGPAVPGDVNAIIGGMTKAGAAPTTLAPGAATAGPAAPTIAQGAPPTVTPPAQPTPQVSAQGDQPPAPTGPLTIEQYRAQHPSVINPSAYTVTPDPKAMAQAEAERQTAAQNLQAARLAGDTAAANKALNAATEASSKIATLQQQAQVETAKMQLEAQNKAEALTQQGYNDAMTRQQQADLKAQELAQTAAQAELERQNKIDLAKLQAGQTWHQKLQEQSAQNAQENTLKPMAEQAAKAHNMNLSLAQLQPLLQDLPPGGGALGAVLNDHPDLAPLFNQAGILNDKSADAVRLVNGLVANISTQMKPTGLGALREYEWDAFKSQLPSMLSTPAGQQKAIALLMNMNNRIGSEASWMNNYFSRKVPDDMSDKPGAMMPAHNLESDNPTESVQQRMDRELGPIVPSAPPGTPQGQWEQSLPPGKPYYKTWALGDPKDPTGKTPLRDASGNVQTKTTLEVRPWR